MKRLECGQRGGSLGCMRKCSGDVPVVKVGGMGVNGQLSTVWLSWGFVKLLGTSELMLGSDKLL